jgi:hypothetical protein
MQDHVALSQLNNTLLRSGEKGQDSNPTREHNWRKGSLTANEETVDM